MALRLILWFSFGGFRAAHRMAWQLSRYRSTFETMEGALRRWREQFESGLPDSGLTPGATQDVQPVSGLGDVLLATFVEPPADDGRRLVVFRAAHQFPSWRPGAWEVFDGLWLYPDGSWKSLTEDEINELW